MGIFMPLLKRQKEYVETAIGLGRRDFGAGATASDRSEASARAPAAAMELLRKVLRFMESMIDSPF
jgi:hypothetical protein